MYQQDAGNTYNVVLHLVHVSLLIKSLISDRSCVRGVFCPCDLLRPALCLLLPLPRLRLLPALPPATPASSCDTCDAVVTVELSVTVAGVREIVLLSFGLLGPVSGTPLSLSSKNWQEHTESDIFYSLTDVWSHFSNLLVL